MRPQAITIALACVLCAVALLLVGCSNPDAQTPSTPRAGVQNTGEPTAPPPPNAKGQAPADVQRTPVAALRAFAALYMNWTYQTLAANQQKLATLAVGTARLTEQQAAHATAADTTITRAHLQSSGQLVSIAPDETEPGAWVIVTREQTSGSGEYEGLPASYHVTIAKLAHPSSGYAVESWEALR